MLYNYDEYTEKITHMCPKKALEVNALSRCYRTYCFRNLLTNTIMCQRPCWEKIATHTTYFNVAYAYSLGQYLQKCVLVMIFSLVLSHLRVQGPPNDL